MSSGGVLAAVSAAGLTIDALQLPGFAMFILEESLQTVQFSIIGLSQAKQYARMRDTLDEYEKLIFELEVNINLARTYYGSIGLAGDIVALPATLSGGAFANGVQPISEWVNQIFLAPYEAFARACKQFLSNYRAVSAENVAGSDDRARDSIEVLKDEAYRQLYITSGEINFEKAQIRKMYNAGQIMPNDYNELIAELNVYKRRADREIWAQFNRRKNDMQRILIPAAPIYKVTMSELYLPRVQFPLPAQAEVQLSNGHRGKLFSGANRANEWVGFENATLVLSHFINSSSIVQAFGQIDGTAYPLDEAKRRKDAFTPVPSSFSAAVSRVIDGDTIVAGEHTVRLVGINAAEISSFNGEQSSAYLKGLVLGKDVTVKVDADRQRDVFGRVLGVVVLGSTNINIEMLRTGRAILDLRGPNSQVDRVAFTAAADAWLASGGSPSPPPSSIPPPTGTAFELPQVMKAAYEPDPPRVELIWTSPDPRVRGYFVYKGNNVPAITDTAPYDTEMQQYLLHGIPGLTGSMNYLIWPYGEGKAQISGNYKVVGVTLPGSPGLPPPTEEPPPSEFNVVAFHFTSSVDKTKSPWQTGTPKEQLRAGSEYHLYCQLGRTETGVTAEASWYLKANGPPSTPMAKIVHPSPESQGYEWWNWISFDFLTGAFPPFPIGSVVVGELRLDGKVYRRVEATMIP